MNNFLTFSMVSMLSIFISGAKAFACPDVYDGDCSAPGSVKYNGFTTDKDPQRCTLTTYTTGITYTSASQSMTFYDATLDMNEQGKQTFTSDSIENFDGIVMTLTVVVNDGKLTQASLIGENGFRSVCNLSNASANTRN